jgi:hypothetical protein
LGRGTNLACKVGLVVKKILVFESRRGKDTYYFRLDYRVFQWSLILDAITCSYDGKELICSL